MRQWLVTDFIGEDLKEYLPQIRAMAPKQFIKIVPAGAGVGATGAELGADAAAGDGAAGAETVAGLSPQSITKVFASTCFMTGAWEAALA